ncbi:MULTISPECIES: iron-sulfur cluster biosynthesis family protein [unclassified Thermoactinomyces]|uniref:iron-sulfur cluster biosynthesis family protein n=1 Tax=unclassified Thermoactinomyces TaxID=2634588 RepID=UPI0018DCC1EB|nr:MULTISPECIES: iron-sulfur cluster biosynthesis family protein [unclassified Thermoactinomyces]MBH8598023.1 iron-sulfur cluster biosynthesis family protein [Thermoactinomyces sp. CICC 10523]MBH8603054.1 iron-sulfur cluster biosynthesis family protein [Thermoactinomyces sp. CICC 10522]MBH8607139.1 iron-sulfur cluster biosynthesis family protein [Thermoactinomyces sp. CICC 10521]
MRILVTDEAYQTLVGKKPEPSAVLRIAAITEGCGCSNDAMYEVNWDLPQENDRHFEIAKDLSVVIDPGSQLYFEPELIIDFDPERGTFSLKNKSEIFIRQIFL